MKSIDCFEVENFSLNLIKYLFENVHIFWFILILSMLRFSKEKRKAHILFVSKITYPIDIHEYRSGVRDELFFDESGGCHSHCHHFHGGEESYFSYESCHDGGDGVSLYVPGEEGDGKDAMDWRWIRLYLLHRNLRGRGH